MLDPELEGILREVAADPRSTLLRVERPNSMRGYFERQEPVGVRAVGLTNAERHLLAVHRGEISRLFRDLCNFRLLRDPRTEIWIDRHVTVNRPLPCTNQREWTQRVHDLRFGVPETRGPEDEIDLLHHCVGAWPAEDISITQIALTSIRLQPNDQARNHIALDLIAAGQPRTAARILRDILAGRPRPFMASYALENLALIQSNAWQFGRALETARRSYLMDESRCEPAMNWLFNGVLHGTRDDVLAAASVLDERIPSLHDSVDFYVNLLTVQRQQGVWKPTPESVQLLNSIEDRLGATSRRIADVTR